MRDALLRFKQYLLSGVSHIIPFVACGGILIATAIACSPMKEGVGPDIASSPWFIRTLADIGGAAFTLMVPVLAGYIAYGMADKPGLVPGMVGGWIATHLGEKVTGRWVITKDGFDQIASDLSGTVRVVQEHGVPAIEVTKSITISAGFLGGIVAGLLAGFVVMQFKKLKPPRMLRPVMPILVIPVLSSLMVGITMYLIGVPIADAMTGLGEWLKTMGHGSAVTLALIIGAMIAFDMGGPVNKTAFFFGVAMIAENNYAVMGACAVAICIPPLGLGLATFFRRSSWTEQERDSGIAALAMGSIGITEGAIPFAAADPLRVIPAIMLGSMAGAVVAMLGGAGDQAPHGGLIVLPVVINKLAYVAAVAVGMITVALTLNLLRAWTIRPETEPPVA